MIHTINISTKTRRGDAYSQVAINEFPIIYIDDEPAEGILDDPDFIESVRKYIKNSTTYNNAVLNIKTLSDNQLSVSNSSFKLKDYIKLKEWE